MDMEKCGAFIRTRRTEQGLSSFALCLAAQFNELQGIRHRVLAQDWAGLADTIDVSVTLCVLLALATLVANALLFLGRKK